MGLSLTIPSCIPPFLSGIGVQTLHNFLGPGQRQPIHPTLAFMVGPNFQTTSATFFPSHQAQTTFSFTQVIHWHFRPHSQFFSTGHLTFRNSPLGPFGRAPQTRVRFGHYSPKALSVFKTCRFDALFCPFAWGRSLGLFSPGFVLWGGQTTLLCPALFLTRPF